MFVGLFDLRNLIYMLEGDSPSDAMTRLSSTFLDPSCLLEKIRHRRRFCHECERTVGVDSDDGGYWYARFNMCGLSIEFLAEIDRFDALSSKSRTNRRRWSRLTRRDEQSLDGHNKKCQSGRGYYPLTHLPP